MIAQRRQEDGLQSTTLHCGPTVYTRGFRVKEAVERQDLYENECDSKSELYGEAVKYSSLCAWSLILNNFVLDV